MIVGRLYKPSKIIVLVHVINDAIIDRFVVILGYIYLHTPSGFILTITHDPRCTHVEYGKYTDIIQDTYRQFVAQYMGWMKLDRLPIAVNPVSYGRHICADSDYLYVEIAEYICVYSFRSGAFAFDSALCFNVIRQLYRLKPSEITATGIKIIADYRKYRHDDKIQHHRYADKYADVSIICRE